MRTGPGVARSAAGAVLLGFLALSSLAEAPTPPQLSLAFEVRVEVAAPQVVGSLPGGRQRRIVEILGGTVEGPGISGHVLPGGADWQLIRESDGFTEIDARYTIETEDGGLIYVSNVGIRHAPPEVMQKLNAGEAVDPSLIYFRAVPKFETSVPELQWLMKSVFIAVGERYPSGVVVRFWQVH
jgi:hypothetical protein